MVNPYKYTRKENDIMAMMCNVSVAKVFFFFYIYILLISNPKIILNYIMKRFHFVYYTIHVYIEINRSNIVYGIEKSGQV